MKKYFNLSGYHQKKCLRCNEVDVPDYIRFCDSCWKILFDKFF